MIDTIRLKITVDIPTYMTIAEKCIRRSTYDPDRPTDKRLYQKVLYDGAGRSAVKVELWNDTIVFLEFSVPKFLHGTNILLVHKKDLPMVLSLVTELLDQHFLVTLPSFDEWTINRVDFCYAWKFDDETSAQMVLNILKSCDFPRKDPITRKTSLSFVGTSYVVRVYMKHPEFMTKGYKYLNKWGNIEMAEQGKKESQGVLRFEVEMRDEKIRRLTDKTTTYHDHYVADKKTGMPVDKTESYPPVTVKTFMESKDFNPITILNTYLTQLTKQTDNSLSGWASMTMKILRGCSTHREVVELYNFMRLENSTDPTDKYILKQYDKNRIGRLRKKLQELNVGVWNQEYNDVTYALRIPSPLEVNKVLSIVQTKDFMESTKPREGVKGEPSSARP